MESNKEEALVAKQYAEKRFAERDFASAKSFAIKAQMLCPELEGISQMVATFDIYVASEAKVNGEVDFYSILGLKSSCDRSVVKKHYKRLSAFLHPDKNQSVGADGALRLVSDAWAHLSNNAKRAAFDLKRNGQTSSTMVNCVKSSVPPTFWTVCNSCQVQYEYLRKYVNKRLSCKNCRSTFIASELRVTPVNASSYTASHWSVPPNSSVLYYPASTNGHSSEYVSDVSFQYASTSGYNTSINTKTVSFGTKVTKRRKVDVGGPITNGMGMGSNTIKEAAILTENGGNESLNRRAIPAPIDVRVLLINKAREEIRKRLKEMGKNLHSESGTLDPRKNVNTGVSNMEPKRLRPLTLTVPDSDYHDFDRDRAEDCFKPKQIWAMYDEEDGMPRLYCLIREVISVNPFKILVSYLGSKTDTEFGIVNWISSGFTKSCGHFRATNTDTIEQVNMFSHLLRGEKAGRGGCVRIYPRVGDVWALYREWSPKWDWTTPYDTRHQYEMVEVVKDYNEEAGVCVAPLLKLERFKTVYQRNTDVNAMWWIPRREMVRFSHQVPSWSLKEAADLPGVCWDLDPAATPGDLLKLAKDAVEDDKIDDEGKTIGA